MRCLELFAGAGGAALGLHRAGFEHVALCEWDAAACATLRAAMDAGLLDRADVLEGDVRTVDWSPYVGRVDAVWGSPPCQEWSTAGKREGAKGERNGWPWTLDVLDAVRPAWFMAENVDGMLKHAGRAHPNDGPAVDVDACPACWFHARLLPELHARFASVQWTVWDAASLVVPQHRRRLILVCGPRPIRWPEEQAAHPEIARQERLFGTAPRPYATIREALGWQQATVWQGGIAGCGGPTPATSPAPSVVGKGTATVARSTTIAGPAGNCAPRIAASEPWRLDGPAPAVTGGSDRSHVNGRSAVSANKGTRAAMERAGIRRLTVAECAALQSFPPEWPWQGTKTEQYRQIGNACPAPMIEAIGRAVLDAAKERAAC